MSPAGPARAIRYTLGTARFLARRPFTRIVVPDAPAMRDRAREKLLVELQHTTVYLEYGAGGSTVAAAGHVDTIVTVENDRKFLDSVTAKMGSRARHFVPIHVDTGWTRQLGHPVVRRPTPARVAKWKEYPVAPWRYLERAGLQPDLILVDGRFRVACVLESLLRLGDGARTRILLDDYAGRSAYSVIERFVDDLELFDRLAAFSRSLAFDAEECRRVLESSYADYR